MNRLLIVGSANVDYVMSFDYLPSEGQTLISKDYRIEHGGKGANQAVACARLKQDDTHIDFICHLGSDAMSTELRNSWLSDGINEEGITHSYGMATGSAMIFIGNAGENMIGITAGANATLTSSALEKHTDLLTRADWVLAQLEIPSSTVLKALKMAKQHGAKTILNPAPASAVINEIYPWVDIITPNAKEAEAITGIEVTDEESAAFAAQMLHALGPPIVIITLGKQGAYVSSVEFSGLVPAQPVKAVDTVTAGDTFNGALMVALSEGQPIVQAVTFANKASAITVTRYGAQRSIPYRYELD